jgi:hypothetical protein
MSARQTPFNNHNHDEDALFDYGDLIAGGRMLPPSNELEATLLRVQSALGGSHPGSPAMPHSLKQSIWENIMNEATRPGTPVPTDVWGPWSRNGAPPASPAPGQSARLPTPRMVGTIAAHAVLALLIIFVGFAAWRGIGGYRPSGGDGNPPTVSAVAMQAATPESSETAEVVASPVAPEETLTGCGLSGDIPIVPQLAEGESPLGTTALYLTRNDSTSIEDRRGTLTIGCEGEKRAVLAENVTSAGPGPWPGVVQVSVLPPENDDMLDQSLSYVDIATGAKIEISGNYAYSKQGYLRHEGGNPWIIGPSSDDPATTLIADLRTMEVRPFSEVAGVRITENSTIIVSTPADDGTIAIGSLHTNDGPLPGDLLLLGDSFDDVRWISVPDTLSEITGVSLSPDGQYAAVLSMGEDGMMAMSYRYSLISTSDGAEIAVSEEIERMDDPFVAWVQDGGAIAYLAGSSLQTLAVDGSGLPETVFEAESQLTTLQSTWDSNVVVARTRSDRGADPQSGQTAQDVVYAVNVTTGDVQEFPGIDASASVGWITEAGALVMFQWTDQPFEPVTYTVFDPVTGSQIGEIVDAPSTQVPERMLPTIGAKSVSVSRDGRVEVIALGTQHIYAFTAGSDGLTMQRVESPPGLLSEVFLTASVFLSPDGSMLSLTGEEDEGRTRYLISLDDPNAEWLEIPTTVVDSDPGYVTFTEGVSD